MSTPGVGSSRSGLGGGRGQNRGRGKGQRGRGRGRGSSKLNSTLTERSFLEDDDDDICQQAMGQFELETSVMAKALESANAATELPGFDDTAGQIWIYPTNRPVRDYQFQMVETSLFNNTLVSLPTGLGKTFIAAVVMYNFHRWYPQDLIIFMAPTRPLVTQQLEACHNIVGIHPSKTVELTGQTVPKKREELWRTKSVFFLTPQVMTSDLTRGFCPSDKVRCIVVDEAHKALGQHAYAQVIAMLSQTNTMFRVLALSATPGSDLAAVRQVFKNLLISRVELRSENSPDVLPYIHSRQVDKVVVPLEGYLVTVYDKLMEVYQTYTGKLLKNNAIQARDGSSLTQFQLLKAREVFRTTLAPKIPNYQKGYIEVDFATSISLAHALELLSCHGLRTFYIFLQGILNKEKGSPAVSSELKKNTSLQEVLTELQKKLNISASNSSFNMSSSALFTTTFSKDADVSVSFAEEDNPTNYLLSHPKMKVLKDIILSHFKSFETKNETTRVMIFSQYRDSVQEIGRMLSSAGPLVKPMVFIGQANTGGAGTGGGGRGLKQKDQVEVVQRFRQGGFNVLVSTCVGEEGLDIGEVDLIICFDASKSPTRLVQRMGRTGRQRQGRIIFLLTKGKEERSYSAGFSLQNSISKNITNPSKLYPLLYKFSPRMVPAGLDPQCFKMNVVLTSEQDQEKEDVYIIEDDDDKSSDVFPLPTNVNVPVKKTKGAKQTKTKGSKGKITSRPGTASSTASSTKSITEGFNELFKKSANVRKQQPRIDEVEVEILPNADPNDDEVLILENHECMNVIDQENYDLLFDIFDVVPAADAIAKPCLNIPKLPPPIKWCPEYDSIDKSLILLSDDDLKCLAEKLAFNQLAFQFKDKCECGNDNNAPPVIGDSPILEDEDNNFINKKEFSFKKSRQESESNSRFNQIHDGNNLISSSKNTVSVYDEPNGTMDLDDDLILAVDDPFFNDDDGDDWIVGETHYSAQNEEEIKLEFKKPNSVKPLQTTHMNKENFAPGSMRNSFPAMEKAAMGKPSLPKLQNTTFQRSDFSSKITDICLSDDSSTTSNDEEFLSPIWKKKLAEVNAGTINKPESGTINTTKTQIKIMSDDSSTSNDEQFHSPIWRQKLTGATLTRPESKISKPTLPSTSTTKATSISDNDSSTTSNDEEFRSPVWKQKLANANAHASTMRNTKSPAINPPTPQIKIKQHIYKDDLLLFDDDEDEADSSTFNKPESKTVLPTITSQISQNVYTDDMLLFDDDDDDEDPQHWPAWPSPPKPIQGGPAPPKIIPPIPITIPAQPKPRKESDISDWIDLSHQQTKPIFRSQFKKPAAPVSLTFSDDDDFAIPSTKPSKTAKPDKHKKATTLPPSSIRSPSPLKNSVVSKQVEKQFVFTSPIASTTRDRNIFRPNVIYSPSPSASSSTFSRRDMNSTFLSSSPVGNHTERKRTKKKRKLNENPYIDMEADVSDDGSSSGDEVDEFEGLDEFDASFVDNEDDMITHTQQVRYIQSVKDVPLQQARVEPLPPPPVNDISAVTLPDDLDYESDSFCVPNEDAVEFADVGVFTQAMNDAREAVLQENPHSAKRRKTRRQARMKRATETVISNPVSNQPTSKKRRRRIIFMDDSSDED